MPEYDLKTAARRGPTGETWAQMFSVGFSDLCPTYGVKLLRINETSRIFTTPFLRWIRARVPEDAQHKNVISWDMLI